MEQLPTIEQMAENVELQFKQKVHEEVMERLKKFTFKENMMIAFTPVIITELIWMSNLLRITQRKHDYLKQRN